MQPVVSSTNDASSSTASRALNKVVDAILQDSVFKDAPQWKMFKMWKDQSKLRIYPVQIIKTRKFSFMEDLPYTEDEILQFHIPLYLYGPPKIQISDKDIKDRLWVGVEDCRLEDYETILHLVMYYQEHDRLADNSRSTIYPRECLERLLVNVDEACYPLNVMMDCIRRDLEKCKNLVKQRIALREKTKNSSESLSEKQGDETVERESLGKEENDVPNIRKRRLETYHQMEETRDEEPKKLKSSSFGELYAVPETLTEWKSKMHKEESAEQMHFNNSIEFERWLIANRQKLDSHPCCPHIGNHTSPLSIQDPSSIRQYWICFWKQRDSNSEQWFVRNACSPCTRKHRQTLNKSQELHQNQAQVDTRSLDYKLFLVAETTCDMTDWNIDEQLIL